jgi:hypothetical protein
MIKAFRVSLILLIAFLLMAQQPVSVSNSPTVVATQSTASNLKVDLSGTAANATAIKVDNSAVTQPISGTVTANIQSNASVNLAQYNGSTVASSNPVFIRETDGTNSVVLDPCRTNANTFKPISQTASTQLVTGTSAKKIYICSINIVTAAANNVALVEGTGTTCATGTAGMAGGTTAATGWNFAANGGLTQGNGMGSIMAEATNADNLCLLQSAAVQLSGVIGYVVQ